MNAPINGGTGTRSDSRRSRHLLYQGTAILLAALIIMLWPFAARMISQRKHDAETQRVEQALRSQSAASRASLLRKARAYNRDLARQEQTVFGVEPPATNHYFHLLNASGGAMGVVDVPKAHIHLPIYHGTDEQTLARGAGHLFGTSLPIGGKSTHAVITGHSGLARDTLFTHLDRMRVADTFTITVLQRKLRYKVDRITVIEPDNPSSLRIERGQDRVTLMTCTPYGINTHRLLVSGVRIHDGKTRNSSTQKHSVPIVTITVTGFIATASGGAGIALLRRKQRPRHKMR